MVSHKLSQVGNWGDSQHKEIHSPTETSPRKKGEEEQVFFKVSNLLRGFITFYPTQDSVQATWSIYEKLKTFLEK